MPLTFLIMLAPAHFENADLVVFAMRYDRDAHRCTGHQGSPDLHLGAVADCQNLIKNNLLAYVRSNLFYFNFFASSNPILLATGFYDRVHVDLFNLALQTNFYRVDDHNIAIYSRPSQGPIQDLAASGFYNLPTQLVICFAS